MKKRVWVEVTQGKKSINFEYPKDMPIAETIWKEIRVPLIKCEIEIYGYAKINGKSFEVLMQGMKAARDKLLKHPFLTEDQKAMLNSLYMPDNKTRPESINTRIARNLRPVVNYLTNEHGQTEDEATDLVLEIVKGFFNKAPQVQKIKLPAFQRAIRKV